ncbi:MAG TPA: RecB family exonuclease [Actinomycetales bacterium]|nr:RecB family exonuclease [Actinomycetales bacterium]
MPDTPPLPGTGSTDLPPLSDAAPSATASPAAPGGAAAATASGGATAGGPAADGAARGGRRALALSPSRAGDYRQCPLKYRLRAIDRLEEPSTVAQVKGTLVHAVLEELHAWARPERTYPAAVKRLKPTWEGMVAADDSGELAELVPASDLMDFLVECRGLLKGYFIMENPAGFDAHEIEKFVQMVLGVDVEVDGGTGTGAGVGAGVGVGAGAGAGVGVGGEAAPGVPVRGFIDRVDIAPTGEVRIVDYKTGKKPHPRFQNEALFQMRFYALVWWRMTGHIPEQLRLMYLRAADDLTHSPTAAELERFEAELTTLWAAIVRDGRYGDFRPKKSKLCGWCSFQELCPAFGGTPPEYPGWPGAHGE